MVTEDLIEKIIADEMQGMGVKPLVDAAVVTADALTSGLVTEVGAQMAEFAKTPTQHLQEAWTADTNRVLDLMTDAVTEVARACIGRNLTSEQAMKALIGMARDPRTRRRLRTLWAEAATSDDERITMLAVGYFVQASNATLQERMDVAIRSLFPEDADVLGKLVELDVDPKKHVVIYQYNQTPPGYGELRLADDQGNSSGTPQALKQKISLESVRSLSAAHCIEIKSGTAPFGFGDLRGMDGGVREAHSARVLPIGTHLHQSFGKVDWRKIAAMRSPPNS